MYSRPFRTTFEMASKEITYKPLERSSDDLQDGVVLDYVTSSRTKHWERIVWMLCVIALVIGNGIWAVLYYKQKEIQSKIHSLLLILGDFED